MRTVAVLAFVGVLAVIIGFSAGPDWLIYVGAGLVLGAGVGVAFGRD
jgi:hypothetical protein